jgi:hypothetical protein
VHNVDVKILGLFGEESGAEGVEGARGKFENCEAGFVDCGHGVRGFVSFLGGILNFAEGIWRVVSRVLHTKEWCSVRTKSRTWMPGLDLLAEYKLDFPRVFFFREGEDFGVDCVEEFFGVLRLRHQSFTGRSCLVWDAICISSLQDRHNRGLGVLISDCNKINKGGDIDSISETTGQRTEFNSVHYLCGRRSGRCELVASELRC